jgi:hypothetical protein
MNGSASKACDKTDARGSISSLDTWRGAVATVSGADAEFVEVTPQHEPVEPARPFASLSCSTLPSQLVESSAIATPAIANAIADSVLTHAFTYSNAATSVVLRQQAVDEIVRYGAITIVASRP